MFSTVWHFVIWIKIAILFKGTQTLFENRLIFQFQLRVRMCAYKEVYFSFKSATARHGDRLNGFENGKTQLFNSWGVGKWAYFQKKWSVTLSFWDITEVSNDVDMAFSLQINYRESYRHIIEISLSLQLEIKSWLVTGDSLSMDLLNTERGNRSIALSRTQELQNTSAAQYKTVRASLPLLYCLLRNMYI